MSSLNRASRILFVTACLAAVLATVVSLTSTRSCGVDGWVSPTYNLDIATHFTQVGQQQGGSVVMTLVHSVDVTLNASAEGANTEVFVCQTGGSTDTLVTKYKFTGADLSAPDATWVTSTDFINPGRSYQVPYTDGVSEITLQTQCTSDAGRAQDAGSYTASLRITATW